MSESALGFNRPRIRPVPTPRVVKSERTRAAIMDAALEFLWARPFRDMSVNALMETTAVSRPAFYQYFQDINDLMENLLRELGEEIVAHITPWLEGAGDPVALLEQSLTELVRICHRQGPFVQAISDAAPMHERLESAWGSFLNSFDDLVAARIEADQAQGLIAPFDARPVAVALVRTNASTVIRNFGQRPRSAPEPVLQALKRIWIATLYGDYPPRPATRNVPGTETA